MVLTSKVVHYEWMRRARQETGHSVMAAVEEDVAVVVAVFGDIEERGKQTDLQRRQSCT
jgi:hypothetical protein